MILILLLALGAACAVPTMLIWVNIDKPERMAKRVARGMTYADVQSQLGTPVSIWESRATGEKTWLYQYPWAGASAEVYVYFDVSGHVSQVGYDNS